MLLANVCAGFIRLCCGVGGKRRCLGTLGSPGGSTHLGGISFANLPFERVELGLRRRACRWTRSLGGVRQGYCLRGSLGVHQITGKSAAIHAGVTCSTGYCLKLLKMLVLVRLPSLHGNDAFLVSWNQGALRENCRQTCSKISFSPPFWVFSFVETLFVGSGVSLSGVFGSVGLGIPVLAGVLGLRSSM